MYKCTYVVYMQNNHHAGLNWSLKPPLVAGSVLLFIRCMILPTVAAHAMLTDSELPCQLTPYGVA